MPPRVRSADQLREARKKAVNKFPMTHSEIAVLLGISRQAVVSIERSALRKMRTAIENLHPLR